MAMKAASYPSQRALRSCKQSVRHSRFLSFNERSWIGAGLTTPGFPSSSSPSLLCRATGNGATVRGEKGEDEVTRFQQHQASVPRLSHAEEARTLVDLGRYGVLSTLSSAMDGHPSGSVVGFAADTSGMPLFAFSKLSPHTGDIRDDPRIALTILVEDFQGAADSRVTLNGTVSKLTGEEEMAEARKCYLAKNPDAFWVDFGDFQWFKMDKLLNARLVGGFARAGQVAEAEYMEARPDPVAQFSGPVCGHMNADHAESIVGMVAHNVGLEVEDAKMVALDSLGFDLRARLPSGEDLKMRLAFPSPVSSRKELKDAIVVMSKEAKVP